MNKPDLAIIKSPEAEKMRQMVTEGFYDRSRIALWMFEVIGREYDDMAEWSRTLRLEAFPQTCTWSIFIWEFVYGYEPDDALPLDYRRQRLLSRRQARPPINPARIEAALTTLTGCPVCITENVAPYTFRVNVDESGGNIYDYRAALKKLRQIKPSHLSFRYESRIEAEYTVTDYTAGAAVDLIREFFNEEIEIITDTTDWGAGVSEDWVQEYLVGDEIKIQTDTVDYNASTEVMIYSEYFWDE